jgi:hypothetical protein
VSGVASSSWLHIDPFLGLILDTVINTQMDRERDLQAIVVVDHVNGALKFTGNRLLD